MLLRRWQLINSKFKNFLDLFILMFKRGQITIFIMVGVLILAGALTVFLVQSYSQDQQVKVAAKQAQDASLMTQPVKSLVERCIEETIDKAILDNSFSGGYFILPEKSTKDLFFNVPFYKGTEEKLPSNKGELVPSDEILAKEIAEYVDTFVGVCLQEFTDFAGFQITFSESSSKAVLNDKQIIFDTHLPVTVKKGDIIKELTDFNVKVSSEQFYQDILVSREVVKSIDKDQMCVSCFSNIASENNLLINLFPKDNGYIFDIKDNDYLINGENLRLGFAIE